jgi:hypothetical protein
VEKTEELHDLYSSPRIIRMIKCRRIKWAGHVARMGDEGNAYRILEGKPKGKRLIDIQKLRWVYKVKSKVIPVTGRGVHGCESCGSNIV